MLNCDWVYLDEDSFGDNSKWFAKLKYCDYEFTSIAKQLFTTTSYGEVMQQRLLELTNFGSLWHFCIDSFMFNYFFVIWIYRILDCGERIEFKYNVIYYKQYLHKSALLLSYHPLLCMMSQSSANQKVLKRNLSISYSYDNPNNGNILKTGISFSNDMWYRLGTLKTSSIENW